MSNGATVFTHYLPKRQAALSVDLDAPPSTERIDTLTLARALAAMEDEDGEEGQDVPNRGSRPCTDDEITLEMPAPRIPDSVPSPLGIGDDDETLTLRALGFEAEDLAFLTELARKEDNHGIAPLEPRTRRLLVGAWTVAIALTTLSAYVLVVLAQ